MNIAMLGVEPETLVYNDITPQFIGFGLAFRCIVNMKEDEVDIKVYNPTSTISPKQNPDTANFL